MSTKTNNTKRTAGALLALALLLGGGSYGVMSAANAASANSTNNNSNTELHEQELTTMGSIQVADDESLSEAEEATQYAGLAKITEAQAIKAAEAKVGGTVTSIDLESEDGSLVYEVIIGGNEVVVDAGNGVVLQVETDTGERHENEMHERREEEESLINETTYIQ